MDIHTATEQAYTNGYKAAENVYKEKQSELERDYEKSVQEYKLSLENAAKVIERLCERLDAYEKHEKVCQTGELLQTPASVPNAININITVTIAKENVHDKKESASQAL